MSLVAHSHIPPRKTIAPIPQNEASPAPEWLGIGGVCAVHRPQGGHFSAGLWAYAGRSGPDLPAGGGGGHAVSHLSAALATGVAVSRRHRAGTPRQCAGQVRPAGGGRGVVFGRIGLVGLGVCVRLRRRYHTKDSLPSSLY
jgi:hypothetical protein